jgi:excinuclease ABC subunit A
MDDPPFHRFDPGAMLQLVAQRKSIAVRGAREHNLQNIDVEIPRDKLVVLTGLSGSGKSSLAFDTIYAEGQRRYVESLSAYARQFLNQMPKPDVDSIDGLAPAISIEQKTASRNPRSTVGTVTEVYDYLRLLYARVGRAYCWSCGKEISCQTPDQIVERVMDLSPGTRISVLAPIARGKRGEFRRELGELRKQGFVRVSVDGEVCDLADEIRLDRGKPHDIEVYVDRLVVQPGVRSRLADSVETALRLAHGLVKVAVVEGSDLLFSERHACVECGVSYPEVAPRMFSFNSPHGACPKCGGLGVLPFVDPDLVVGDPDLSIDEGVLLPWGARPPAAAQQQLAALARHFGFATATPWKDLPEAARSAILHGTGTEEIQFDYEREGKRFQYARAIEGLVQALDRRYRETDSESVREDIERFMRGRTCDLCEGTRLRRECLYVRVGGLSIVEVSRLSIQQAHAFFSGLKLGRREREIAQRILRELVSRLSFLMSVGLEYLTLDRISASLSGGEAQRIRLATQIGSSLVGVLYVLDEPTSGLHPRDTARLLATLKELRDLGNTVLVVEHDEETILSADHVIDMGPGAGSLGGRVVAAGAPEEILRNPASLTGLYLSRQREIPVPARRRRSAKELVLEGARGHNLRDVTLRIPLGTLTCVTGVSGSGKSTAIIDTLFPAAARVLHRSKEEPQPFGALRGLEHLDRVVDIDQSPIGRTPRSNPATYTGLFAHVRDLFAQTPDARMRGYGPGRFTFNAKGGRCEACQGDGVLRIEMHFLPDVFVTCEECGGRRYNRETLEIRYRGRNIADVLDLSVEQALEFLGAHEKIREKLETLRDVGLGYLQIGQPATTMSGGEAQRVKLSKELAKRGSGRTLYILDEPTTGLHFEDIRRLLEVLNRLVDAGNTVVVIEHQLDVIKTADQVIDLGPEGGDAGGEVVAAGTPEEVARVEQSHTGRYLRRLLGVREVAAG